MKKRVVVNVAGQSYTLVGEEEEAYIQQCGAYVDSHVRNIMGNTKVSLMDAAVLAALDLADEYFKEKEAEEHLRKQLKEYLEDSAKTKLELAEARREIFRLQNKK